MYEGGPKLGVVEEKGCLCGGRLFEGHSGGLGAARVGYGDVRDFAARECDISLEQTIKDDRDGTDTLNAVGAERKTYQKLKKSRTSFSLVSELMFLT